MPETLDFTGLFGTTYPYYSIPTRQQKTNLKQFCLRDLTPAITVISIILQARAIRFPVAIMLPEGMFNN